MIAQMLPWFAVTLLIGVVLGLVVGIFLASALVKGHYSHFISNTQPLRQAPPNQSPHYDGFPYADRRNYPH